MKEFALLQLKRFVLEAGALCAFCAAYLALSALSGDAINALYAIYIWALCPIVGGALTVRAVLKGMQPYLALWALPICPAAMQLLITGTGLDMSAVMAYALIGLICSAAGDELNKRAGKRGSKRHGHNNHM